MASCRIRPVLSVVASDRVGGQHRRGGRVEGRRLTASRFSAWQQERLEGQTEKQPHRTVGRLGFGYKDRTVQRIQQESREIHRRDVGRDFTSVLSLLDDDAQAARRLVEMFRHAFFKAGVASVISDATLSTRHPRR